MKLNEHSLYCESAYSAILKSKIKNILKTTSDDQPDIDIIEMDDVISLTKKNKNYFLIILQMMVDILRLQYNRKYIGDFGQPPRSVNYVFEYNKTINEITVFVSLKIKGISNNFIYQTSTTFRLNSSYKIIKAIGDEFLYMLSIYGNKQNLYSKDNIKEIFSSLPSNTINNKTKQFYRETKQGGPAQNKTAQRIKSNDNTIRL